MHSDQIRTVRRIARWIDLICNGIRGACHAILNTIAAPFGQPQQARNEGFKGGQAV